MTWADVCKKKKKEKKERCRRSPSTVWRGVRAIFGVVSELRTNTPRTYLSAKLSDEGVTASAIVGQTSTSSTMVVVAWRKQAVTFAMYVCVWHIMTSFFTAHSMVFGMPLGSSICAQRCRAKDDARRKYWQ